MYAHSYRWVEVMTKRPLPPAAMIELMKDIMNVPDWVTGGPLTLPEGAEPLDEYLCHVDCPSFVPASEQCALSAAPAPCCTEVVSLVCTLWLKVRDERVEELREKSNVGD